MKIASVHVEGFGVLNDLDIEAIPPGLSVIHGPNETGKSTLLDFVRGVIFGFPDRRQRRPLHEPLRGGRHGGSIQLVDDADAIWTISRHADSGRFELVTPTGELGDPDVLHRILGGADDKLFRAVFAFGLGELSDFNSLDGDDVRDLVFSAGILGAGRSATRAVRALEQRQATIIRPKQKDARVNQLRERLGEVEDKLRAARTIAEGYSEAEIEYGRLKQAASDSARAIEDYRRRENEIEKLRICWPMSRKTEEAAATLRELGDLDPRTANLIRLSTDLGQLSAEQSGYALRLQQFNEQSTQKNSIERSLASIQLHLGSDVDLDALESRVLGIEMREKIDRIDNRHKELRSEIHVLEAEVRHAADELNDTTSRYARELAKRPVRDDSELRESWQSINELKRLVAERDRRIAETAAAQREQAYELLATNAHRRSARPWPVMIAFALVSAIVVTLIVALAYDKDLVGAAGVAVGFIVVVIVGIIAISRSSTKVALDENASPDSDDDAERLDREISERAGTFELEAHPNAVELESIRERLELERLDRSALDELLRAQESAERHFAMCRRRVDQHEENLAELEAEAADYARQLGFAKGLTPSGLAEAIKLLLEAKELTAGHQRVSEHLGGLEHEIASFRSRLSNLCDEVGQKTGDLSSIDEVDLLVDALNSALQTAMEQESIRREARRLGAQSIEYVNEALGEGDDADRLRRELGSGALLEWDAEHVQLRAAIAELATRHESELAQLRDAERDLQARARSEEIASLELEREGIEADLDRALADWAVLALAQSMLTRTLDRYEKERQPVVIARAAQLFEMVTDGRYSALVAREDDDARHHGIVALTRTGQRIDATDLSRGTAEQLYLCLRLAFATTFAERAVSLPLVLDDVLVNFDPARATAVAKAIDQTARNHQVLAFTCHPHVVEYFQAIDPLVTVIELSELVKL